MTYQRLLCLWLGLCLATFGFVRAPQAQDADATEDEGVDESEAAPGEDDEGGVDAPDETQEETGDSASDEAGADDGGADDESADDERADDECETPPCAEAGEPCEGEECGAATGAQPGEQSGVRGRIVDSNSGEGLPDALVVAQGGGQTETTLTNETGGYVLVLDPGIYSVSSFYDLYHGSRMPRVRVRSARFSDLTLTLDPIDAEVVAEEVEIVYRADTTSAAAQDQLRAASSGIGEGMGSAQMSEQGASDAGSAARNVVGVTLEGTSLNIRGLGGRYTLVLLNGVALPSTDPDQPSVDLDLFPTSVIDNIQVAKAFLPNLPGNFAGGVLDIRTVRFPRQFTFEASVSTGFNSLTSFQDRLTYRGGDLDWLGVDDGRRSFPQGRPERIAVSRDGRYQDFDAIEEAGEAFSNVWQFDRDTAYLPFGISFVLGDSIDLGDRNRFGFLVTAGYDYTPRRWLGLSLPRPTVDTDQSLSPFNDYSVEGGVDDVQLSALGTASLELGQNDVISFLTLFNRSTTNETQFQTGTSGELGGDVDRWQLQFIARSLWFNQLRGDHRNMFGSRFRLRWSAYGAYGTRSEPDRRSVAYGPNGSRFRWLEKSQSGERFYSDLEQLDFGGLVSLRFPLWSEAWGTLGGQVRTSGRDFFNRRVRMLQDPRNTDASVYESPVEEIFSEQGIGTVSRIQEFSRADDSYISRQNYYAGYAMAETPLFGPLSLTTGVRLEAFHQMVENQSPFEDERPTDEDEIDPESFTDRTDVDVLPAGAFRLELMERMNLRAAYGMTVARPQVRELAPYQYYDFIRDRNVQGNPRLARTLIQNVDLRWEWFFGRGEILSLSVFYKYFDQPIELQIFNPGNYDSQFINAEFAHNVGGEAEFRFNFRHFADELRFISVGGNIAFIWSTVQLPEDLSGVVQAERPLTGQAPYVANLSLRFDEPDSGISASLVYNVTGPRISDIGTRVNEIILPNIERAPFHSLDLILGWRFEDHLRVRFKLRNLLLQVQDYYQGDFLTQRIEPGMSGSLSLSYSH